MSGTQYQGRAGWQRTGVYIAAGLVVLVGALGALAVVVGPRLLGGDDGDPVGSDGGDDGAALAGAEEAVASLAVALEAGSLDGLDVAPPVVGGVGAAYQELVGPLGSTGVSVEAGSVTATGPTTASAPLQLAWTFPGELTWNSSGVVELVRGELDDTWRVSWSPSIVEASLRPDDELGAERIDVARGSILARDGTVLVGEVALVDVGIRPSRVQDLPALTQRLAELVGIDPAELSGRVEAADPDAFVDVVTLTRADYDAIRDEIFPLPGTVFRETSRPQAIDDDFARALLGRSGEATAEVVEAFPGLFGAGDIAGLSGLQYAFNAELTGRPGFEITVARAAPDPSSTTTATGLITTSPLRTGPEVDVLATFPAVEAQTVITTLDPTMQRAAEDALRRTELTSGMVVIEVSTGEVVALANGPTGSTVNFAMTGRYEPGSIFKVITSYALLQQGLRQTDAVECPARVRVEGREFGNAEDEVFGTIPFRSAFAHSCNTAFVGATLGFADDTLAAVAAEFGVGDDYQLGVPVFTGDVPVADGRVDLAASSFGQGRVLFSPFNAAVMAATAAGGTYRSPRLITSPAPPAQAVLDLAPGPAGDLRELMRAVVTEGTGRAVAGAQGGPVSGKTGTAEFGNEVPPRSHAWFVGFQGDLAFAVFVEGGEFGGATAAPIARDFLDAVAGRGIDDGPPGAGDDEVPAITDGDDGAGDETDGTNGDGGNGDNDDGDGTNGDGDDGDGDEEATAALAATVSAPVSLSTGSGHR
ncbi:MAG: penicillin-binding transpeptidase domain-containing protein [Acidimicrobiales bacterium]